MHHDEFTEKERADASFDGEDPDSALAVIRANANEEAITPEEIRKLVRKIDLALMPLVSGQLFEPGTGTDSQLTDDDNL